MEDSVVLALRSLIIFPLVLLTLVLAGPGQWLHEETHRLEDLADADAAAHAHHAHAHPHAHHPGDIACDESPATSNPASPASDHPRHSDCHTCHLLARHVAANDFTLVFSGWNDLVYLEHQPWQVVLSPVSRCLTRLGARDPPIFL